MFDSCGCTQYVIPFLVAQALEDKQIKVRSNVQAYSKLAAATRSAEEALIVFQSIRESQASLRQTGKISKRMISIV